MRTDLTSILHLAGWGGRAILSGYGLGVTLVAVLNLGGLERPALGILALALMWFVIAVFFVPGRGALAPIATSLVLAGTTAMTLASTFNIAVISPGYATWHMGAVTFLLLVLALRGRIASAWFGYAVFAALEITSTIVRNQDLVASANDVVRQAGTLFVGTLFAVFLQRASRRITAIQRTQLSRVATEAARHAAVQERERQVERLERYARPALERILSDAPLDDSERAGFAVLESSLRDGIRAAGFRGENLAAETMVARHRGIQVILLDDRGAPLEDGDRDAVEIALIEQLRGTSTGTVTARLSPHDSEEVATIVVDEGGRYRRVVVTRDGVEVTHLS